MNKRRVHLRRREKKQANNEMEILLVFGIMENNKEKLRVRCRGSATV